MMDMKDAIRGVFERGVLNDESARQRAIAALSDVIAPGPIAETAENELAGLAFTAGHALGEIGALQRARNALSDPRARGVELAVLDHLAAGLDIEDALRKASAPAPVEAEGNVTAFPVRR